MLLFTVHGALEVGAAVNVYLVFGMQPAASFAA